MSDFEKILNKSLAKPDQTIREHTDALKSQASLLKQLKYISSDVLYNDLLSACEYHDYGKANSEFQKRIKNHKRFDSSKEVPHNVLSMYYVDKNSCNDYLSVCFAVLYHHYHSKSPLDILEDDKELIKKFLSEFEENINKRFVAGKRLKSSFNELLQKSTEDKKDIILLKGFLHKCDYSASAGIKCEIENKFLSDVMTEWASQKTLRHLQEFCLENNQGDIIATAPTGMGKTEAGLLWCGNHKCFFVLPLKTAINAMYERIKILVGENDYRNRVGLLHSDTKTIYLNEIGADMPDEAFDYIDRTKQLSMPITVCTPDQIFDFVLKYPGYEYKLATASYSRFIIDEIQAYDPELLAAIIYGIKLIKQMGGKIAILTATLPPFVHEELKNILGECPDRDFSDDGITRHNMKVYHKAMCADDIIGVIDNIRSDSVKKFLVVCNSIDTANDIFSELKEHYKSTDIKINLFHARFTKKDRKEKEDAILEASKGDTAEIWVSTSVVEASLDIDFDILFTELSELFSLFQRMGRVNRKGLKSFEKTNCYVYTELQGNAKKYNMYDKDIHALSEKAVINFNEGIIDETIKHDMIETYLSCENVRKTEFFTNYQKTLESYEALNDYLNEEPSDGLRKILSYNVIPLCVYEENKAEIENALQIISSGGSKEEKIKAQNIINQFTVPVSKYQFQNHNCKEYTNYKDIFVVEECEYGFENGLVFTNVKKDDYKNPLHT
ncbi:MAG: CRISPR-associated helicase Cas3' [Clostridia bacterium]|nr:CRISPR-associated helicase Cas3' [Clostridia bacterium]